MSNGAKVRLRSKLRPGDLGTIIRLHGVIYGAEYGWDHTFEAMVAGDIARFVVAGEARGRLWVAERGGEVAGCVGIVGQADGSAQLRWFLVDPAHRGAGIGRALLDEALAFCRAEGFRAVFLWTVKGLAPAAHGHHRVGDALAQQHVDDAGPVYVVVYRAEHASRLDGHHAHSKLAPCHALDLRAKVNRCK